MSIEQNINMIKEEIPEDVQIVAAAKTRSAQEIRKTVEAGVNIIGENYIQEMEKRIAELNNVEDKIEWHVIGHLQTNKINRALRHCDCIQTVESEKKAKAINKRVPKANREILPVLIEVNIGNEDSKFGVSPNFDELKTLALKIDDLNHLRLKGLMTIEPYGNREEVTRKYFKRMKKFFDRLKDMNLDTANIDTLSMGISNSYKIAIEEGSTMIRPGTAIYGPRDY